MGSDLGFHCLSTSHRKDARLIWINYFSPLWISTPKWVLWQTVKTWMKCRISGSALFAKDKTNLETNKYNIWGEIITFDPSIYTMDHPDLTVSNFMGNSTGPKRVNHFIDKALYRLIRQYS